VRLSAAVAGGGVLGVAAAHAVPSVLTIPALHRRLLPRLAGRAPGSHVALTFDDGPDPAATPEILDELSRLALRATFFLLGSQLDRAPDLGRRIVAEGHELGVHGWAHRPHLLLTPKQVDADLARACALIIEQTGVRPRFWRPPNGILSGAGLLAARRRGLRPVLWTVDGRDWDAAATPETVFARLSAGLQPGGTVLLHDSDITSAPGSWRSTLGALPELAGLCMTNGWPLGPLREHWAA
jgi:peptidoglycan/xylan/chitin deacetylase (PgdA/CDA1 family)